MEIVSYKKGEIEIYKGVENLKINIIQLDKENITYEVENVPICEFDQHSRARIGVKFYDYKVSDKPKYTFYTHVFVHLLSSNQNFLKKTLETLEELEQIRNGAFFKTSYNLMSRNCSYKVRQSLISLKGQANRRLKFCEEEFIVGVHWLLRDKLINLNMKDAESLLPGCDFSKKCDYSSADYLSNMFGCLFTSCNRHPSKAKFATFNESCTNIDELERQLKIKILR